MQNVLAVVSLKTIVRNAERVLRAAKKPLIAVVKDDAYGHGAEAVALALENCVSGFAVSTAEEGAALRTAGVSRDILVLTPPLDKEDAAHIAEYSLTASITSLSALRVMKSVATGSALRAHIAVNTGMNRYGVRPERAGYTAREARRAGVRVEGVYSHLYCPQDRAALARQRELFEYAVRGVRSVFPHAVRHLSATGGLIEDDGLDAVRCGLSLYGYLPEGYSGELKVKPAMKIYARVAQTGTFTEGGAGYARAEKTYRRLHTLRLGYGDGFFRAGGASAIGKLCMDACVREGGARYGAFKPVLLSVTEYAREHGTTEYEALVNVARKAVKRYV